MQEVQKTFTLPQYYFFVFLLFFILGNGALPAASAFYILDDLGGGIQTASWGTSFYILGNLITKPLALTLGFKIGKIRLLKISLWITLLLSFGYIWVQSYYAYLTLRFVIGLVSGPMFLIATSVVGPFRPDKLSQYLLLVMIMLVAVPVICASYGAILAYQGLWRWTFNSFNSLIILALIGVYTLFKGWEIPLKNKSTDWVGFALFALMCTCLGFCLVTGQTIDGFRSHAFNIVFSLGLFFTLFFFKWNRVQPNPIFANYLLKNKQLVFLLIATFVLFALFYAIVILLSFWLHLYVNYSLNWVALSLLGVLLGPVFVVLSFSKKGLKLNVLMFAVSIFSLAAVSFYTSFFNSEVNFTRIIITKVITGFSLAFAFPPLIYLIQKTCLKENFADAFCFFAVFRMAGSFVGVAYFITLWERRAAFYYQRLGGELTVFSQKTEKVLNTLNQFHFNSVQKIEGLNVALVRQSQSLALDDCYRLIAWIAVSLGVFTLMSTKLFKNPLLSLKR